MKINKEEKRGRPIQCKYCGHKFKITNKENRNKWIEEKFSCPICNELFCYMTETEKNLQIIQAKFKKKKEEKYLKEMYDILVPYAESIIKKHYINEIQDKTLLSTYAKSAVSLLIESDFYKKKDFYINSSFGSRLQKKCIQALRSKKESYERVSTHNSLNYTFEDGHNIEYEDVYINEIFKIEQNEEKILLLQRLCKIIFEIGNYCESPLENYIRLINVLNFLEGGEKAIDNFFQVYGRYGKFKTMKSLLIIKNELNNIMLENSIESKNINIKQLTHNDILTNKFKINNVWQKVLLVTKDTDNIYYFFNGKWCDANYFNNLEIKK